MAEDRKSKPRAKHAPRKKEEAGGTWGRLKDSAVFWLVMVAVFTIVVVGGIIWLSALLSGNLS